MKKTLYILLCCGICLTYFAQANTQDFEKQDSSATILQSPKGLKYYPQTKDELKKFIQDESVNLGDIDTSAITDMSGLFHKSKRKDFSGIESWDTSNVESMMSMFVNAEFFNANISKWDTSKVRNMSYMFSGATSFNQALNSWNVSNVENMNYMFFNAAAFNQPLNHWNVSKVESMDHMFAGAKAFDQSLDSWNVQNLKTAYVFKDFIESNQPIWYFDIISKYKNRGEFDFYLTNLSKRLNDETYKINDVDKKYIQYFLQDLDIFFYIGKYKLLQKLEKRQIALPKPLNYYKQQLKLQEQEWLDGYFCADESKQCLEARSYFTPTSGCAFRDIRTLEGFEEYESHQGWEDFCCVQSDSERFCNFTLTKALKMRGKLYFRNNLADEDGCGAMPEPAYIDASLQSMDKALELGANLHLTQYQKELESALPQWFKEGIPGEIVYEAELEVVNHNTNFPYDFNGNNITIPVAYYSDISACGGGDELYVKNISLTSKIAEIPYPRSWYEGKFEEEFNEGISDEYTKSIYLNKLDTKDSYVILRQSPNGKILAQIPVKNSDKIILFNLANMLEIKGDTSSQQRMLGIKPSKSSENSSEAKTETRLDSSDKNSKGFWLKVLYFPPNVENIKGAIIGYIHSSQIKSYEE